MKAEKHGVSRKYLMGLLVLLMGASLFAASSIYDFTLPSIDGKPTPLSDFKGKVILVVNVASRCGFTPQYTALESIYEKIIEEVHESSYGPHMNAHMLSRKIMRQC